MFIDPSMFFDDRLKSHVSEEGGLYVFQSGLLARFHMSPVQN